MEEKNFSNEPQIHHDPLDNNLTDFKVERTDDLDMDNERPVLVDSSTDDSSVGTRSNKYSDASYLDDVINTWPNSGAFVNELGMTLGLNYQLIQDLYDKFQKYQHVSGGTSSWGYENANAFLAYLYANYPEYSSGLDKFIDKSTTNYDINIGGWFQKYFGNKSTSNPDSTPDDSGSNDVNLYGYTPSEWDSLDSSEQTLAMEKYLDSISTQLFNMLLNNEGSLVGLGRSLLSFYNTFGQLLQKSKTFGMSAGDSWNASSQIFQLVSGIINNRLNVLYERENWLFQNEYNNPINSIKRLMDAGINPAWYFDSMDKSNAGSIGSTPSTSPNLSPISGETSQAYSLEQANKAFGAVGSLGNLFNGSVSSISGAAASTANAGYLGAMKDNIKTLTPLQSANMVASINSLNAQTQTENQTREAREANLWAQRNELLAHARNYADTIDVQKMELQNALDIATMNNETSRYTADVSASASRYSSRMMHDLGIKQLDGNAMLQILSYCEDLQEEETYVDSSTGEVLSRETLLQNIEKDAQSASASASNGVIGGMFGLNAGVDVSAEISKMNHTLDGSTYTYGGRNYTKSLTRKRVFNPERYMMALNMEKKLLKGLRDGSVDPVTYGTAVSSARAIQERERKNVRKYTSQSFAKYCIDWATKWINKE